MRFLQGIIVGALLVVGGAYYHDTRMQKPAQQQLVNWDHIGAAFAPGR